MNLTCFMYSEITLLKFQPHLPGLSINYAKLLPYNIQINFRCIKDRYDSQQAYE